MVLVEFGHTKHTRIGERHRRLAVLLRQLVQIRDMLLDAERDRKRAVRDEMQQEFGRLKPVTGRFK